MHFRKVLFELALADEAETFVAVAATNVVIPPPKADRVGRNENPHYKSAAHVTPQRATPKSSTSSCGEKPAVEEDAPSLYARAW